MRNIRRNLFAQVLEKDKHKSDSSSKLTILSADEKKTKGKGRDGKWNRRGKRPEGEGETTQ